MAQIVATTDYAHLAGSERVIEVALEDRSIKADITHSAEAVVSTGALFRQRWPVHWISSRQWA
jgi:3-hydroxyacyl-CoA dehydrogenase/enoyl-CoA hydratase/3-hydroxybutyryl-CoA epimerase